MRNFIFLALGFISSCALLDKSKSDQHKTLFTVEEDSVTVDEFIYAFQKNRPLDSAVHKDEVDEYLILYKKFKLKVAEAEARGMDTTEAFLKEYSSYMSQLENSYLQSTNDTDSLVLEAFNRLQYQISAAHLLLMVEESASPEDTLKVYNKIFEIRDSIVNQGKDFNTMAAAYSEDPSAKQNGGSLGYFSVFQMVYPFENAAFSTAVGEVSMPIRTRFGYHLIKVDDKRPNEGRIRVAHIMIRASNNAEEKAFNLYNQLQNGADWNQLCAGNSEDYQSSAKGGELAPFTRGQIVKPFSDAAYGLTQPGEMSEPIQTQYGWHIIKLIERLPVDDFDKMQQQLSAQVRRDVRSQVSKQKMLDRLANENNLVEIQNNIQRVIDPENHSYDENHFVFENDSLSELTLFTIKTKDYTSANFYAFIEESSRHQNTRQFLFEKYKDYKDNSLTEFEKAHLGDKYPEYNYLQKEYHDGILLFSIMEELIWNPASNDSTGIEAFYQRNKNNYLDSTTIEIAIFSSPSKSLIDSVAQEHPRAENFLILSKSEKEALMSPNNDSTKVSLQLEFGEMEMSNHSVLSQIDIPIESTIEKINGLWYYLLPIRLPGEPRLLANVRGRLIADYQEELEKEWIGELERKFQVNVDDNSLKYVYKKLDTQ